MEFSEKLLELRKAASLTQEELAEAIFVSRTAVSKWESGRGYPSIDSLKELSRFFHVSIDELLGPDEIVAAAAAAAPLTKLRRFSSVAISFPLRLSIRLAISREYGATSVSSHVGRNRPLGHVAAGEEVEHLCGEDEARFAS